MKKSLVTSILVALVQLSNVAHAQTPLVMGYWENWGTYQNYPMPGNAAGSSNPTLSAQFTGINSLAYAFLEVASDGSIMFSDVWSDLDAKSPEDQTFCQALPESCPSFPQAGSLGNFNAFVKAPVAHHVISVGGAGHDNAWENAFANQNQFVASLQKLAQTHPGIDGLDIDYEPVGGVPQQRIPQLIQLVQHIKQTLPNLIISYTIPANSNSIQAFGAANWKTLSASIDYVNVMGYDMHGAFDRANPYTALHSALFTDTQDFSDDAAIQTLIKNGIAANKIVLGMPFYGRAVGGVQQSGLQQLFTQSVKGDLDDAACSLDLNAGNVCSGMTQYKTLASSSILAIPVTSHNVIAGVYSYDATQKTFVSYDNPASAAAKTQYAMDNHLAGVMFWSLRFDLPVDNSQSLLQAIDKVAGISSHPVTPSMKLELTNNDPHNPVTIRNVHEISRTT